MSEKGTVTFSKVTAIAVGEWLREHGLFPANEWGAECRELGRSTVLGILRVNPNRKRSWFSRLLHTRPKKDFFGVLTFDKDAKKIEDERVWKFEIAGTDSVELCTQIAQDLATQFNVRVECILVTEGQRTEQFMKWI